MFPHERSLVKKLEGKPFALLGINTDGNKNDVLKKNAAEMITWRSWWDRSPEGPICHQYGVQGFPTLVVLDGKGVIRYKGSDLRGKKLDDAVETLLKEMAE
jgi:hypothetical protein